VNFQKSARVRKRHEYLRFFGQSEVRRFDACIVFRIAGFRRLGITVKSKSGSVFRNRIKREIRECFRQHQNQIGQFDYNVVVNGPRGHRFETAKKVRKNLESIWGYENRF
jgi:ribonuclease P protein component